MADQQPIIDALVAQMTALTQAVAQIQQGNQTQMAALVASIEASATAATAAATTAASAPPVVTQAKFARNPGQYEADEIIDFSSTAGIKRNSKATSPLAEELFNHTSGKVLEITNALRDRSDASGWRSGTGKITAIKVGTATFDLFKDYGQFTETELKAHVSAYLQGTNHRAEQNSEQLARCIMASVTPNTHAELMATYEDYKINGEICGELVFKGLMNKTIVDNKQTTRYLQDEFDNLPSNMTSCDSNIPEFILQFRNITSLLEARGTVLPDKFKVLWRGFELCKDENFRDYMARKQEAHEEDETSPPSLTIDRLLKFALDKYTDRTRTDNHIWGSSSKREEDFVALSAEINSLKGNLKLQAKIIKKQNGGGGGGGGPKTPSGGPPAGKSESHKARAAKKAQWASECKALKKVPPTSPRQTVRTFTKAEHPGFSTNSKPHYWCPAHLMWCVHTSDQCDLKKKQEAAAAASKASKSGKSGYSSKAKRDASGNTKDQAMAAMLDYFSNEGADSDSDDEE